MAKEQTIKQKQKYLAQSTLFSGIFLSIVLTYLMLMLQAYMYDNPRAGYSDAVTETLKLITKDPLYFWPITYNIGLTLCVVILVVLFTFVGYTYNKMRVHHDINTMKGSAKWAEMKEMVEKYADFDGKDYKKAYNNAILSENFQMSMNQGKHYHALNTLILGATGSGKSRYYLKPNLLQMNSSYVITDPSGGILQECGEALRRFGYNVKVFDLVQMGNCDTYNPLRYCHKESDIKKVVQAFIKNTSPDGGGGSKDPFWDDSMNAFMCACIAFLTTCPEGSDVPYAQIPDVTGGNCYKPCFANLCELTRMANKKYEPSCGIKLHPKAKLGDGKNNTANASELAAIFENLRAYEAAKQECEPDEMVKPYCLREWENFRIAPEKTSTTILMTTAVRLDPFNIEQVRNLTSGDECGNDTLNLDDFGNSRDVLFVITPTNDRTYNFLVSFLYTQLFDILYQNGETKSAGSIDLKLPNGELVRHFSREKVNTEPYKDEIAEIKKAKITKVAGNGIKNGTKTIKKGKKKKKVSVKFDDSWYDITTPDGELISRRPTKELAEEYVKALQNAKEIPGNGKSVPTHVRFLLDEFPNLGEIPEFKEKLATMRKYEISCTVICQSITQLKGMYEKDYEVVDANCPQTIFLGGDENSNNEYISKKIGMSTIKGMNNSVDNKKVNSSYNVEQRELVRPEELGRMPFTDEIVLVYGEDPIYDKKFDYPAHKNYKYTHDYAIDLGIHDGSVFDRTKYVEQEHGPLVFKLESPIAIPGVEKLSTKDLASKMKQLLGASNPDIAAQRAANRAENNFIRYQFEADSEEGEF